jgi:hypothetical protein
MRKSGSGTISEMVSTIISMILISAGILPDTFAAQEAIPSQVTGRVPRARDRRFLGQQFESDAGLANRCCERGHLSSIWNELAARYSPLDLIDLLDELPRRYSRNFVYERMIIWHDGQPTGHFTPFGNQAVAQVIADRVRRQSALSLPLSSK